MADHQAEFNADAGASLFVCVTCRAGDKPAEGQPVPGQPVPGQVLFDAVAEAMAGPADAGAPFVLRPVVCLGNCEQGCSAAMTQDGKWSYLLGRLTPAHGADLVAYARAFVASENGTVWRSGRAASLRDAIVARIPGHDFAQKETA